MKNSLLTLSVIIVAFVFVSCFIFFNTDISANIKAMVIKAIAVKATPTPAPQIQVDLSSLTQDQINELANLNKIKVQKERELERAGIGAKPMAQSAENSAKTNLENALKKYNVPLEIQQKLDEINKMNPGWLANYNSIFVKSDAYKKNLLGLKFSGADIKLNPSPSPMNPSQNSYKKSLAIAMPSPSLPDFFDWRNKNNQNYISSVKNQGNCGSCWAFASTAVLEGAINTYYNRLINPDLSEQDLVSCFHGTGCNGASTNQVKDIFTNYFINTGLSDENCFPYTTTNNACSNKCSTWENTVWKTGTYKIPSLTVYSIKEAVMKNGPVEVGMYIYDDFFAYSGGNVPYRHISGGITGGHAITIVGWGKYDGADYWIIKNSWGTNWGEDGYFKIFAGDSGINSIFAFGIGTPIFPPTSQNVLCADNDKDEYCYWGTGSKPTEGCPACNGTISDCDDSNMLVYSGCGKSTDKTGALSVVSVPDNAKVYIKDLTTGDFVLRGLTPLKINLNVGEREIKIETDGYSDYVGKENISENQTVNLNAMLSLGHSPEITYPLNNDILRAGDIITIKGTAALSNFLNYKIEFVRGSAVSSEGITLINGGDQPIINGDLATWNTSNIISPGFFDIKLTIKSNNGESVKYIYGVHLDPTLKAGWPVRLSWPISEYAGSNETTNPQNNAEGKVSASINIQKNSILAGGYYFGGTYFPITSDINRDGFKEIITVVNGKPPKIFVYRHNGSLLWEANIGMGESDWTDRYPIIVEDINNDGLPEIIASNNLDSKVYAFKNA